MWLNYVKISYHSQQCFMPCPDNFKYIYTFYYSYVSVSPNSFHHQYLLIYVLWWIRAWHTQRLPFAVIHPTNLMFSRYITVFYQCGLQIWLLLWHIPFRERQGNFSGLDSWPVQMASAAKFHQKNFKIVYLLSSRSFVIALRCVFGNSLINFIYIFWVVKIRFYSKGLTTSCD